MIQQLKELSLNDTTIKRAVT